MEINLTPGEGRMLEKARVGVDQAALLLRSPIELEDLRLAERALQQGISTVKYLTEQHKGDVQSDFPEYPAKTHNQRDASQTDRTPREKL